MRSRSLGVGVLTPLLAIALALLAPPADASRHVQGLSVSPNRVDLGRVHVDAPGCSLQIDVLVGCVQKDITLTNTGTETLEFGGFSTCDKVFPDASCSESGPSWGGMFRNNPNPTSCISDFADNFLDPGETCQLTVFAVPSTLGRINGWVMVRTVAGPIDFDFVTIRVTVRGV
jgi:hypothetical protein